MSLHKSEKHKLLLCDLLIIFLIMWLESRMPLSRDWDLFSFGLRLSPFSLLIFYFYSLSGGKKWLRLGTTLLSIILFVFSISFPLEVLQNLSFYCAVISLLMGMPILENDKSLLPKPLYEGFLTLSFLCFCFYITVQKNLWEGIYIDLEIVRNAFCLLLSIGILTWFRRILGMSTPTKTLALRTIALSFLLSVFFLSWRMTHFGNLSWLAIIGIFLSLTLQHFIQACSFCAKFEIKIPFSHVIRGLPSLVILALILIALHIETSYAPKDRSQGVFAQLAPHLLKSEAAIEQNEFHYHSHQLRVISFNAWAVESWIPRFIVSPSRDLDKRLALLPKALARYSPDIVILQEVWKDRRKLELIKSFKELGFAYSVYGTNSLMDLIGINNGLLIISRYPLDTNLSKLTFTQGTRLDEGPIFARKGAIKTRIKFNEKWIDLYASHTGGFGTILKDGMAYNFKSDEQTLKAKQTEELASFIRQTRSSPNLILGVDLNTHPFAFENGSYRDQNTSPEYDTLTCKTEVCLGLKDAATLSSEGTLSTYDTAHNYYAHSGHFNQEPPGRIDYVFATGENLAIKSYNLILKDFELSDHYGLLTIFQVL